MSPLIKSIRIKTLLSVLVPFVIVLILVAGIGNLMFESNAQEAVKQRDTELAMISAARLSEGLNQYSQILQRIAITDEIRSMDPTRAQEALKRANANGQFLVFDGGVILYDGGGIALTAIPVSAARGGEGFTDPVVFTKVNETLRASFSNVFRDEKSGNDVILIGVPVLDSSGELAGVLAGLCTVKYSLIGSMFVNVLELKAGGSGYAYLVDGNGHLIYHRYKPEQGNELAATEPVLRVTGRETGAVVTRDTPGGKTVISAFAPVPGTQWGVVTHEEWETVFGPLRYFSNSILLLIIAGGAISAILIFSRLHGYWAPSRTSPVVHSVLVMAISPPWWFRRAVMRSRHWRYSLIPWPVN